jgi:hypothetical protein
VLFDNFKNLADLCHSAAQAESLDLSAQKFAINFQTSLCKSNPFMRILTFGVVFSNDQRVYSTDPVSQLNPN